MLIIPAIDIKGGRCVRLKQGDFSQKTVYPQRPEEIAAKFQAWGARKLHVVDLDGSQSGGSQNKKSVEQIVTFSHLPVQLGGGIRTLEAIATWLELGVSQVIVGTMAIRNPALFEQALERFGADRLILAVDARDGRVAIEGWQQMTEITATDFANTFKPAGLQRILYTDIARDGMLTGVNLDATKTVAQRTGLRVTASGGVASKRDLEQLRGLEPFGVDSVVVGRAFYEGHLSPEEVFRAR